MCQWAGMFARGKRRCLLIAAYLILNWCSCLIGCVHIGRCIIQLFSLRQHCVAAAFEHVRCLFYCVIIIGLQHLRSDEKRFEEKDKKGEHLWSGDGEETKGEEKHFENVTSIPLRKFKTIVAHPRKNKVSLPFLNVLNEKRKTLNEWRRRCFCLLSQTPKLFATRLSFTEQGPPIRAG